MIYETEKPETILTDFFGHSNKNKDSSESFVFKCKKTLFIKLNTMMKKEYHMKYCNI